MEVNTQILEYKCPCCNAGLVFIGELQQLKCEYCDNAFDIDAVKAFNESQVQISQEEFQWEETQQKTWRNEDCDNINIFLCPSCGGEILADLHTTASFCPYCDNPTIVPSRLRGGLMPDAVLPFHTSKDDAKAAFSKLCKGKPLLPKFFTSQQQLEKITGMYVPFWLYDCEADFDGSYKATRVHRWSDSKYHYVKTDHYLLNRGARAGFSGIPMDGSSKMDDAFMESIEPFDYSALVDFNTAYLSGYLADKYDVPSENGKERIRRRVEQTMDDQLKNSFLGYATVLPASRHLQINHSKAKYVLFPVWILNTRYQNQIYTFAMNGQTGKMTGTFPICPKRTAAWFSAICAAVTLLTVLVQWAL